MTIQGRLVGAQIRAQVAQNNLRSGSGDISSVHAKDLVHNGGDLFLFTLLAFFILLLLLLRIPVRFIQLVLLLFLLHTIIVICCCLLIFLLLLGLLEQGQKMG